MSSAGFIEADLGHDLHARYYIEYKELSIIQHTTGAGGWGFQEINIPFEALNDLIKFIMRIKDYEATRIKVTDEFLEKQKGVKND